MCYLLSFWNWVVYLSIPTSNHNGEIVNRHDAAVVYLSIPTSNHNFLWSKFNSNKLYIYLFLHQTTTGCGRGFTEKELYIYLFLHQTTTELQYYQTLFRCISIYSYIKPQLFRILYAIICSCISIYSYIKPQLFAECQDVCLVVYLSIPTSNHN